VDKKPAIFVLWASLLGPLFYYEVYVAEMALGNIQEKIAEIAERVASSEGIELVEVECKGDTGSRFVRVYIDKPGGVNHTDCELISRQLGTILDVEEVVPGRYTLEVSSPGLDRKLLKINDYERFSGKKVQVKLRQPVDGRRQFTGRLRGCEQGEVAIELAEQELVSFPFASVQSARLVVEF